MPDSDELEAVLNFIAHDNGEFNMDTFMEHWPKKVAVQRVALGMIVVRSGREVQRLSKSHARLWVVALAAVGAGTLSLMLHLQLSPIEAIGGAIASVAGSLLLRALTR
jgi:hypothetical protein